MIDNALRNFVRQRAGDRCEYCLLPQTAIGVSLVIDHIVARQHGGEDREDNLALCCPTCNRKKGPNLAGIDSVDGTVVTLFHPRKQQWTAHFRLSRAILIGITPEARATIVVLDLNSPERIELRQSLLEEGTHSQP